MRILVVCGRFPEPGAKGDQLRTRQLIDLLAARHRLTVVAGGAPSSPAALAELRKRAVVVSVVAGPLARCVGAVSLAARGRPLQVGLMSPLRLRRAAARLASSHDVVIVSTVRCLPDALREVPVVLDHIDALSANMAERARIDPRWAIRAGARFEARLLARHERRAARWSAAQLVVSILDAAVLPQCPLPVVVPHVLAGGAVPADSGFAERDIDLIFTGNMAYPPNREGALWLAAEIAPRLRDRRAAAGASAPRIVVAGRGARRLGRIGVEVASDVFDLAPLLSRARVAVVPLRSGTGVPNKLLEAAAAGAAIVATPRAARAAAIDVETASSADEFAAAIDRLLSDDAWRIERARAARNALAKHGPEPVGAMLEAVLARVKDM